MRNLAANCQSVYYKLYLGEQEIIVDGSRTGTYGPEYGPMRSEKLSVSPSRGSMDMSPFGSLEGYDRTMTTADTKCPIDEHSILWLDGADKDGPHNYVVMKKAVWKNSVSYAIERVTVRG